MRAFVECEVSMMVCRREQGEKQTHADFYVTMAWYRTPGSLTTVNLNMTFLVMMLGQQNIYPLMIRYHYLLLLNMKNMVCWSSFVLVPWACLIISPSIIWYSFITWHSRVTCYCPKLPLQFYVYLFLELKCLKNWATCWFSNTSHTSYPCSCSTYLSPVPEILSPFQ